MMNTVTKHFETIVITAYIAKQEVIVRTAAATIQGFVTQEVYLDGFCLCDQWISWNDILEIQLNDRYFEFWKSILLENHPA